MKAYIKFLFVTFFRSFLYVSIIAFSLVLILNILAELDFFKEVEVGINYIIFLSIINSPSMIFEMFPFIFLISTQLFFIKLFKNNEIEIFKYSGLKNSKILGIIGLISLLIGLLASVLFYSFSAKLKNLYLEQKTQFTTDGKYLAVITNNGLWIKDQIDDRIYIINSSEINNNFLINTFITEFNNDFEIIRNIQSDRIDIKENRWLIYDAKIYDKNNYDFQKLLVLNTNFNYKRVQTLYSNLSSLNFKQLYELRENYLKLNYSLTEVNIQLLKLLTYPLLLLLVAIFSSLTMFKIKRLHTTTLKISLGLFFCVIIYYVNNLFLVMGSTEKISITYAIFIPLILLSLINSIMSFKINEN